MFLNLRVEVLVQSRHHFCIRDLAYKKGYFLLCLILQGLMGMHLAPNTERL